MKLSVMMITYNHERFIAQALASVLAQRVNFDYEIIVAEDKSTDGTRDIVLDFHRRYPGRIVPLLRDQNLGAMRNFKDALAFCRGEYVALLEGDDLWTHEDKLQTQTNFLDEHPDYAICCHRARFVDETGGGQSRIYPTLPAGTYSILDLFDGNWIVTCSVMYRWGSVGSLPDWFLTLKMGDWPLHILVGRAGKIHLMDEVMSVYRIHQGGIWSSLSHFDQIRAATGMLMALDKHLGFQYTSTIRRTLARSYFEMAYHARQEGNRTETGKHLFNFIRNGGWQFAGSRRTLASFAAYAVFGSWYKLFSRAKSPSSGS
jgi:glycosyltransferase involved in cell wall biosynthesis